MADGQSSPTIVPLEEVDLHLGKRLRGRRWRLGLTQQEVAASCGVRFQQIQKYECAANRMSAARLWQLGQVLSVPASYFYEGFEAVRNEAQLEDLGPVGEELFHLYLQMDAKARRKLLALAKIMSCKDEA